MFQVRQITIIGTGLLGGSIGLGLKAAQKKEAWKIVGLGRRKETLQKALDLGCIDAFTEDAGAALRESQLVILATPISAFEPWLHQIAKHFHEQLIITDVGSTKASVCEQAAKILGQNAKNFIGSHPMAGSEQHGPQAAKADLFAGRPCVLTPLPDTNPDAINIAQTLWKSLGLRLIKMSPQEHDLHAARISHLPHALAVLLVELASKNNSLPMASTGFRDTTRVASGDPQVWIDIFHTNRAAMLQVIDELSKNLQLFRDRLDHDDIQPIIKLLSESQIARDQWIKLIADEPRP